MLADVGFLIIGFVLLVGAGDALVRGAVALSLKIGMPAVIVSATVVAFGTSAPEMLISVQAVIEGASEIALGNVVGSNIANVLMVLGVPALLAPIAASREAANRNLWFMLVSTVAFSVLIFLGDLTFLWGGAILFALVTVMVVDSVRVGMVAAPALEGADRVALEELEDADPEMPTLKMALLIAAGLIGLPLGASFLVDGAQGLARAFGVSEAVIGLTIVALGTSLPELATTIAAALRQRADIAIGSVVGSNIFNVTAIIGVATLFGTVDVPAEILIRDIWVMIVSTLALAAYVLLHRPMCRLTGVVFVAAYVGYVALTYTP